MKSKKSQKSKPIVHTRIVFEEKYRKAGCDALLFMLHSNEFPFEKEKIDEDCADKALEKFYSQEVILTRGELRASAKAVEFYISCFSGDMRKYAFMEEDFPGLLSDLADSLPLLEELNLDFQEMVRDLRKIK